MYPIKTLLVEDKKADALLKQALEDEKYAISKVIKAGVSAFVFDNLRAKRINTLIDIAIARFKEHQTLKDELEKTKTKLKERKLAMDRNIPIGEMAKNVISMAELLK